MHKAKMAVGAGITGIGAVLLLSGLLGKVNHENCIVEGRAFLDEFYDTPRSTRAATSSCSLNSGLLFVIGSIVKVAGAVALIAGLTDMSLLSLSRVKN